MLKIMDDCNIKYNKIWGSEYILMDSRKFMGSSQYDDVIDMLVNIWQINRQRSDSPPLQV